MKEQYAWLHNEQEVSWMNSNHNNKKARAFLLGSLVGGLIASAVALLFAPQSGEQTQEQIRSKVNALRNEAEGKFSHGKQAVESAVSEARSNIADLLEQSAEMLSDRAESIRA
jgi:gas vesicle protein